jgi:hypothetical protein
MIKDIGKGVGIILVIIGSFFLTFIGANRLHTWLSTPSKEEARISACIQGYNNTDVDQVSERSSIYFGTSSGEPSLKKLEYRLDEQAKEINRLIDLIDCIY